MAAVSCPACGTALAGGQERCLACGSAIGAPTEALARDLMRHEAPRDRLVDVPAFRKREPSWKDEVSERVRKRKRSRSEGDLPLFADRPEAGDEPIPAPVTEPEPASPAFADLSPAETLDETLDRTLDHTLNRTMGDPLGAPTRAEEPQPMEVADLPLRPQQAPISTSRLSKRRPRRRLGRGWSNGTSRRSPNPPLPGRRTISRPRTPPLPPRQWSAPRTWASASRLRCWTRP